MWGLRDLTYEDNRRGEILFTVEQNKLGDPRYTIGTNI